MFLTLMGAPMPVQSPTSINYVLDAIANWVNKYRRLHDRQGALDQCSRDEVMRIAGDLAVPPTELRALAAKGPGSADLLEKMLIALGVDPAAIAQSNPAVMRDLQRLCVACGQKGRCQHELIEGTAAEHFHEFCPNAFTLDALFQQKEPTARQ